MIIQFVETYTSDDRPDIDLVTRVMRINTSEIVPDAHAVCGDSHAHPMTALIVKWFGRGVTVWSGYACDLFRQYSFRSVEARGRLDSNRISFSDGELRRLGLAGKLLADQMLPAALAVRGGMSEPLRHGLPRKLRSGEYWNDRLNWRVRVPIGRTPIRQR